MLRLLTTRSAVHPRLPVAVPLFSRHRTGFAATRVQPPHFAPLIPRVDLRHPAPVKAFDLGALRSEGTLAWRLRPAQKCIGVAAAGFSTRSTPDFPTLEPAAAGMKTTPALRTKSLDPHLLVPLWISSQPLSGELPKLEQHLPVPAVSSSANLPPWGHEKQRWGGPASTSGRYGFQSWADTVIPPGVDVLSNLACLSEMEEVFVILFGVGEDGDEGIYSMKSLSGQGGRWTQ